jgi:predicted nucleic acid-binding protein
MGIISTQVLQEFYVAITRKINKTVEITKAKEIVEDYLKWKTITINGSIIINAIDLQKDYKYSFWDSLIISSALEGGAVTLLTEDLNVGHKIKNLEILNPFIS